ncbi:MAG TPA: NAD-dependent epimerase/dehydratase family protein, partial [Vicinamibacteria bacterium]|nr:NAD-dependent epimerase/dehydratase family protein [Vicinamibacteria bacterium]
MRIVVTGGTGFIGREIVRRLLHDGQHDITVTTRYPGRDLWGGRVRLEQAFAGDRLSLGKAFTGAEVVVHAIQFPNHPVEKPSLGRTYMEVDGKGTAIAAETARKLGVRRFVYLSGAGAGQGRDKPWFRAKDMAEEAIRASSMEYGFLRPSWIYGPNDHSMNRFVTFCRRLPVVPVIGDGRTPVWPLHVQDAARCAADLVQREDAKEAVFELGGPERLTMDEVIRTVQAVIGKRRPLLHHPKGLMKLLTRPLLLLPEPPMSPGAVDFVTETVEIDPRPAMDYFGFP